MASVILVVDDSVSIRKSIYQILTSNGYEVIEAVDGINGLHMLESSGADCVITDINMPKMNGLEFIQQARATEKGKYIPILVLTTESEAEMIRAGKEAGATGWIVKPFNDAKLLGAVRRVLDSGRK